MLDATARLGFGGIENVEAVSVCVAVVEDVTGSLLRVHVASLKRRT
jgi:hypothetical protein